MEAASRPESEARLATVLAEAKGVVEAINTPARKCRRCAPPPIRSIARDVATLNDSLKRIEELNRTIATTLNSGRDAGGLFDQRQVLIDRVAEIVPVREIRTRFRPRGALYARWPAASGWPGARNRLLRRSTRRGRHDDGQNGALSGSDLERPSIDGEPDLRRPACGELRPARRDGPGMQAALDALARDLVERFAGPDERSRPLFWGMPASSPMTAPPFDPLDEIGSGWPTRHQHQCRSCQWRRTLAHA
jgi:flagellar hook-associated protein 1